MVCNITAIQSGSCVVHTQADGTPKFIDPAVLLTPSWVVAFAPAITFVPNLLRPRYSL